MCYTGTTGHPVLCPLSNEVLKLNVKVKVPALDAANAKNPGGMGRGHCPKPRKQSRGPKNAQLPDSQTQPEA